MCSRPEVTDETSCGATGSSGVRTENEREYMSAGAFLFVIKRYRTNRIVQCPSSI